MNPPIPRVATAVGYDSMDLLQAAHTFSSVEMALWDALGQARGEPAYRLLGYERAHPKVPYASQLFGDAPQLTQERGRTARAAGFRAVKFGWRLFGRRLGDDADHLAAARERRSRSRSSSRASTSIPTPMARSCCPIELIVSGEIAPGHLLPREPEIMACFGVSWTTVCEAIKVLEAKGHVETSQRVGTRVLSRDRWNAFDADVLALHLRRGVNDRMLEDLLEVRLLMEPASSRFAEAPASMADLAAAAPRAWPGAPPRLKPAIGRRCRAAHRTSLRQQAPSRV